MYKSSFDKDFDLNSTAQINVGGLVNSIRLIPLRSVVSIAEQVNGILPLNPIIALPSMRFYDIEIADNSGLHEETMTTGANENFWLEEVSFDIAKNRPGMVAFLREMNQVEWLVMVMTKNHDSFLLGDIEQPLLLSEDSATTEGRAGANKRVWKLSGMVKHPAYRIVGSYVDIDFSRAFNSSFNFSFE